MRRLATRLTLPVSGKVARQATLLLLLTAALVGFFLILEFLGSLLSNGPQNLLAENPSTEETFGLPNGVRLLQYAVLAVSIAFALAALLMAVGGRRGKLLFRPSASLAVGVITAGVLATAGGYLAFSGILVQEVSYAEHTIYRSFLQSGGLALIAAMFLTLAIAGVVSRYLLPLLLAVWLAAAVGFGFADTRPVDGLYLFERSALLEAPRDYTALVEEYQQTIPDTADEVVEEPGELPEHPVLETQPEPVPDASAVTSATALQTNTREPEPVFWVVGASRTRYLRTATGDVYEKGDWRQLDPAEVHVDMDSLVPDAVAAAALEQQLRLGRMPLDVAFLALPTVAPVVAETDNIAVTPYWESVSFDAGAVPVSKHLQWVSASATYHPFSSTVSVTESTGWYEWEAWVLQFAPRDLIAASAADAPAYLQLPDSLPDRVLHLAEQFQDEPSPYLKADRIRKYLREKLAYAAADPSLEEVQPAEGQDPVDWLLFDGRVGNSGGFSSAFVVLARAAGIPARVVAGWAIEAQAEEQIVYSDQAHQWAEIALEGIGWTTFDPTPRDARLADEEGTDFEELVEELGSGDNPQVREEAAEALGEHADPAALPVLTSAALTDSTLAVRIAAEGALLKLDIEELIRILLTHEDPMMRAAAAEALGIIRNPRAVEPLGQALANDEEAFVREATAEALENIGGRQAEEALLEAAKSDEDSGVRGACVRGLGRLKAGWTVGDVAEMLRADADPVIRLAASRSLGDMEHPAGLRPLLDAQSDDPEETVRAGAAGALQQWESEELAHMLLTETDPVVRAAAAEILGQRRYVEAIPELGSALSDEDAGVRASALEALHRMGTVTWLESGNAIVSDDSGIVGFVAGTTAEAATEPDKVAVLRVEGAGHTNYLRTAVGEVYDDGRWRSAEYTHREYRELLDLAHDTGIFPSVTAAATHPQEISLSLAESDREIPRGIVPISRQLRTSGVAGLYWPRSILFAIDEPTNSYGWSSIVHDYSQAQLHRAGKWQTGINSPYLSLPEWARRGPVYDLAAQITAGQRTPYAQAKAIEQYLRTNYTYAYADPEQQPTPSDVDDPVHRFLFEDREGTCGSFSSAFVFLARSIGLPARVVSGWAISATSESQTVHTNQAHQWAEVAFEGTGWVTFDPTPGGARAEAAWEAPPDDPEKLEEALQALKEAGAKVALLESGGALVSRGGSTVCIGGTSTRQSAGLPHIPVFRLEGAPHTSYLRTATGDVYADGRWRQVDPVVENVRTGDSIPDMVERTRHEWTGLPSERRDQSLLVHRNREGNTHVVRALPTPESTLLPFTTLPVPRGLQTTDVRGGYYPFSATFRTKDPGPDFSWTFRDVNHSVETYRSASAALDRSYLQLPPDLPRRIRDLAVAVTSGHSSPYAKAKALESYLSSQYVYRLADGPEDAVPPGRDPVDWFLFDHREGTSGVFSSAFVVMARSIGIPARVVSGWAVSQTSPDQTVYSDQAHQWAEIALEGVGWVTFEPTAPGGATARSALQGTPGSDPEAFEEALRSLEEAGAEVTRLENGGALVRQGEGGSGSMVLVPGTYTRQSSGLAHIPIFRLEGIPHTGYLRTGTGDVYVDGGWKQVDPVVTDVRIGDSIPDTVERTRHEWTGLPLERRDPALLVHRNRGGSTHLVRALPTPGNESLPFITLPVPSGLQTTNVPGGYHPFSATFRANGPVADYSWTFRLASHSLATHRSASAASDRTYLQLPADLPRRIRELAEAVTSGHTSPYAKAKALESFLQTQYPYRYADGPEDVVPPGRDPVDWFLFDHREGTCGVFSSAFVVMARSIGIPARVVSGWVVSRKSPKQTIYADWAHQWAEVALEGVGWVTFEPTGSGGPLERAVPDFTDGGAAGRGSVIGDDSTGDSTGGGPPPPPPPPIRLPPPSPPPPPPPLDTVTEITQSPSEVRRGQPFTVGGTVRTVTGYAVDGMHVEIYVNETKEHGGTIIGTTTTRYGRFQAEAELPESLELGAYQLLARAVENKRYYESWSDPDISVYSGSGIRLTGPSEVPVDAEAVFTGRLSEDTGQGVPDREIQIAIDGALIEPVVTDSFGNFEFARVFSDPGPHWVEVELSGAEFLVDNRARIDFEVTLSTETTVQAPVSVEVGEEFVVAGTLQGIRGEALSGRSLTIHVGEHSMEAVTDESGMFELSSTLDGPGAVAVRAEFSGDGFVLGSQAATSTAVQQTVLLTVEGPSQIDQGQGGVFAGRLTTSALEPIGQAPLTVLDADGDQLATIPTSEDGTFEYEHPAFDLTGPHSLTFQFPGGDFISPNSARTAFTVLAPTSLAVDAPDVVRHGETYTLTGVLLHIDGSPVADATVEVNTGVSQPLVTDAGGAFSWEGVATIDPRAPADAVETTLELAVAFAGTDHLAPSAAAAEVVVGVPRIVMEPTDPVARGSEIDLRGTVLLGNRPFPGVELSVDGMIVAQSGESGAFIHSYFVGEEAPLQTREVVIAADNLDIGATTAFAVKSAVSMIVAPLDKVRPGRPVVLEARLRDDKGEGIPWATLLTSHGAEVVTDGSGAALLELEVADDEDLTAVPLTFTFDGNDRLMPLTYFIGVPVTPVGFNWLLWVGTPSLIALLAAAGYAGQRMKVVPLPHFVRRRVVEEAPPSDAAAAEDADVIVEETPVETRLSTTLGMEFDKISQDLPNVWGVGEEVNLRIALTDDEGRAIADAAITITVDGSDTQLATGKDGGCMLQRTGTETRDYAVSATYAGDDDYLPAEGVQSFRVVDFREEIVRLYNTFLVWAGDMTGSALDQATPREVELLLVSRGVPVAQKSLDELISRFEEADYSEHPIGRRHYESMFRAWHAVVETT